MGQRDTYNREKRSAKEIIVLVITTDVFLGMERCFEAGVSGHVGKRIDYNKTLVFRNICLEGVVEMKKVFCAVRTAAWVLILTMAITTSRTVASAWEADGLITGTEIEYSGLTISRSGVSVKLTNTSAYDVKASLKLTFFDREGNSLGYTIFGLREIRAEDSVTISNNYLNGNWRACRNSPRMDFSKMTYETIYY